MKYLSDYYYGLPEQEQCSWKNNTCWLSTFVTPHRRGLRKTQPTSVTWRFTKAWVRTGIPRVTPLRRRRSSLPQTGRWQFLQTSDYFKVPLYASPPPPPPPPRKWKVGRFGTFKSNWIFGLQILKCSIWNFQVKLDFCHFTPRPPPPPPTPRICKVGISIQLLQRDSSSLEETWKCITCHISLLSWGGVWTFNLLVACGKIFFLNWTKLIANKWLCIQSLIPQRSPDWLNFVVLQDVLKSRFTPAKKKKKWVLIPLFHCSESWIFSLNTFKLRNGTFF